MSRRKPLQPFALPASLSFVDATLLSGFSDSLTLVQQSKWRKIVVAITQELAELKTSVSAGHRDGLYQVFQQVQGKITAEKLETLIDNAVEKGDAQTLRVLALMAGVDLTERPKEASGEGVRVIIVKPHPREYDE